MGHNILAPSAAHRWLNCTASIPETLGAIDESSDYADEGTAAHTMASWCLTNKRDAKDYPDAEIHVYEDPDPRYPNRKPKVRRTFKADDEMKSYVQVYLDAIRDRLHDSATLLVEQRVSSGLQSLLYGPSDGTADAGLLAPAFKLIECHDLKFGKGIIVVAAKQCFDRSTATGPVIRVDKLDYELNVQLCLYALGLIRLAAAIGYDVADWQVRIVIHQPRLDSMSDADIPVRDLLAWSEQAQAVLDRVDSGEAKYVPSEDVCRWCPKKPSCAALANHVANTIAAEFPAIEDLTEWGIGKALDRVALVKQWVKAVEAAGWAALNAGTKIPGWKLVAGRAGNREWTNPEAVEGIFKNTYRMTYDEMYDKPSLISPTEAERRMKKANPRRWEDLQEHIKRAPGKLTMVRDGDERQGHEMADEMAKVS